MSYWIVDLKDREAQRVKAEAEAPYSDKRFVKVWAQTVKEAFEEAAKEVSKSPFHV